MSKMEGKLEWVEPRMQRAIRVARMVALIGASFVLGMAASNRIEWGLQFKTFDFLTKQWIPLRLDSQRPVKMYCWDGVEFAPCALVPYGQWPIKYVQENSIMLTGVAPRQYPKR